VPLSHHHTDCLSRIAETNFSRRDGDGVDASGFRRRFDGQVEGSNAEQVAGLAQTTSEL